jgi:NADPH2:quinone reductase
MSLTRWDVLDNAYQQVMARAASGELRVDTERVPLADIEDAWQREVRGGRRLVIIP